MSISINLFFTHNIHFSWHIILNFAHWLWPFGLSWHISFWPIYASADLVTLGSDSGLPPVPYQAITRFKADLMLIAHTSGSKYVWSLYKDAIIFIPENTFEKCHL